MGRQRVVMAGYGHDRAMGYRYRIRLEPCTCSHGEAGVRPVLERHFMAWEDDGLRNIYRKREECTDRVTAAAIGNNILDEIAAVPEGEVLGEPDVDMELVNGVSRGCFIGTIVVLLIALGVGLYWVAVSLPSAPLR